MTPGTALNIDLSCDALEDVLALSVSGVGVPDPGLVIRWWQGLPSSAMFKSRSTMQVSW